MCGQPPSAVQASVLAIKALFGILRLDFGNELEVWRFPISTISRTAEGGCPHINGIGLPGRDLLLNGFLLNSDAPTLLSQPLHARAPRL